MNAFTVSTWTFAICAKRHRQEFLQGCGLPRAEATSTQGVIAKHLTLVKPKPMTVATGFMSDARWVGHRYLIPELLAGIVFPGKQDISKFAVVVRTLVG